VITSLRKTFLVLVMTLALLAGLLGVSIRVMATPLTHPQPGGVHVGHTMAYHIGPVCPPPPFHC
jgi:hypothetical protein